MQEELDFVEDTAVRAFVEVLLQRGAPDFMSGFEDETGQPIEAAWPKHGIGIAAAGLVHSCDLDVREVADWELEEILAKFEDKS